MKNFRTSPWDPKENLPLDYARIYKVVDFKRTQKTAVAEAQKAFEVEDNNEYCFPGSFVTLHVKNVPKLLCGKIQIIYLLANNLCNQKNNFVFNFRRFAARESSDCLRLTSPRTPHDGPEHGPQKAPSLHSANQKQRATGLPS